MLELQSGEPNMKTRIFARTLKVALALGLVLTIGLAVSPGVAFAYTNSAAYSGQGLIADGLRGYAT
jgi:hypothetical protein